MFGIYHFLIFVVASIHVNSQQFVGDLCTLASSGKHGMCTLLSQCKQARVDLFKNHQFPQLCGFEKNHPIVCCLENEQAQRKAGEISETKCRQYSAYVYTKSNSPVLLPNRRNVTRNECGHKAIKLIVGGQVAERKEFPHMAAIGFEPIPGEIQWSCGGTIISKRYILTAAHCLSSHFGDAKWVRLGITALHDTNHRQQIKVADLIPHPEYRFPSFYHDIGLLKLAKPARMNPFARPACLYFKPEMSSHQAIATGWGRTTSGGSGSSDLLKIVIDLFDHEYCNTTYKNHMGRKLRNGILDEMQFCAGTDTGEKDTCQGDSGGPLQIYHVDDDVKCMYDIIGVTSFGKICGNSPGVYTKISHYIKWIEDIVWPQAD